jgi:large subunit ribosomal protein L37Ae
VGRTKKTGSTARFGVRYGSTLRKRVRVIEKKLKTPYACPQCRTKAVHRASVGIWLCRKCGFTFAGGAWIPQTDAGKMAARVGKRMEERAEAE